MITPLSSQEPHSRSWFKKLLLSITMGKWAAWECSLQKALYVVMSRQGLLEYLGVTSLCPLPFPLLPVQVYSPIQNSPLFLFDYLQSPSTLLSPSPHAQYACPSTSPDSQSPNLPAQLGSFWKAAPSPNPSSLPNFSFPAAAHRRRRNCLPP